MRSGFRSPSPEARPMMRWWWFGPSVEEAELDRQLTAMAEAGLGGAEVAFVYPLVEAATRFGSPELLSRVRFAAERARELGLRLDVTLGSGWSYGGPHVTEATAARRLDWERREIGGGALELPATAGWPGEELVAAFVGHGTALETPAEVEPLDVSDGVVRVPAGGQPRVLLLAWSRLTGQQVKRAAAGAEGPVLDHYSAQATEEHLRAVAEPLLAAVPAELLGSVFCDSLEVYGADWTPQLLPEFERRRGYDLRPRLYELVVPTGGTEQLRADLLRTLSELYEENFVAVVARWADEHGVPFRIQSYGVPPATLSSYGRAHQHEGEGWGWRRVPQTRWASSAAHLHGRAVTSAEAWTWVHSPSFRATPLDLKGEAHEHLLNGVNHLIGHGWPYSPADAPGLGWFFYAAGALDDRNPWWAAAPDLNRYLQRLCWLMRQGEPVRDVLVYVPATDVAATMGPGSGGELDLWRSTSAWLGDGLTGLLRSTGRDYDLFDDDAVELLDPARVPVVVLPRTRRVPAGTARWLQRVVAAGGRVLTLGGDAALGDGHAASLSELEPLLDEAAPPRLVLGGSREDVVVSSRHVDGAEVHLVVNTGAHVREPALRLASGRRATEVWDAATGEVVGAAGGDAVELVLQPYQALVVVGHDGSPAPAADAPAESSRRRLGGWTVAFGDEPEQPVELPHRWEDEPGRADFSGRATYRTELVVDEEELSTGRLLLDLGGCSAREHDPDAASHSYRADVTTPVGEVAEVWVGEHRAAVLWAPPYRVDVTGLVRPGANELRLVVANTAANALTTEPAIEELVRSSRVRYGHRFAMQELERAGVGLASGLLAVPEVVVGG
nr:glycosyl hydrolase [Auraticoccus cholistanensis]